MKKILIFILCMSFLTVTFSVQSFADGKVVIREYEFEIDGE